MKRFKTDQVEWFNTQQNILNTKRDIFTCENTTENISTNEKASNDMNSTTNKKKLIRKFHTINIQNYQEKQKIIDKIWM